MKAFAKYVLLQLLALPLVISVAAAQPNPSEQQGHVYTQAELDQLLAPVALYPDSLLSQILMASTYPLEVVEAARWSRDNPSLQGAAAVQAVDDRDWDPSVKSLVAFPQILQMMDEKLEWTERLGDAFLANESQVTDAVQSLRRRAYDAGNLQSNQQQRIERQDDSIVIEPANPTVVYVPYYDPTIVYGPWLWPAYPPVYWAPWPGYYPGAAVGFYWSGGVFVGASFFFGAWDWPHHYIRIVDAHPFYYHRIDRRPLPSDKIWRHDPEHRRGVPYRNPATRTKFRPPVPSPEKRRDFRGYLPPAPGGVPRPIDRGAARPGLPPRADERRGAPPPIGGATQKIRPGTPSERAPVPGAPKVRPPIVRPVPEPRPNALEGLGSGKDVRRFSERGRASAQPPPAMRGAPVPQPRAPAPSGGGRAPGGKFGTQGGAR